MSSVFRTNQIDKSLNRLDSKLVNLIVDGPDERVLRAQRLSRLIYLTADWLGLDHFCTRFRVSNYRSIDLLFRYTFRCSCSSI